MKFFLLVLLIGLVGVSWTQPTEAPFKPSSPRGNCFKRSFCGGRADGKVCVDNRTLVACFDGNEVFTQLCFSCVDGGCECPHCSLNTSTGSCDPDTGACECQRGYFGDRCQFDIPCVNRPGTHCFSAMNLSSWQASLASAPNVLTICTEGQLRARLPCASACVQEGLVGSCVCPNGCSGHGRCKTDIGTCECMSGLFDSTYVCMTPNMSTTTVVHCSAERIVGQAPCVSGLCARHPLSTDITCILDSYPCPVREYSGACSCGPTSVREACPVPTGFCDTRWDGFFCSNGSIVECYGGKTLNSTACSESEICSPSGLNSARCIPRPPQAPPIGVFIDEPFVPFAADFYGDDGLLVPTYDRCISHWSPNVCLSDVLLKICSTDRTFDCMFGCMQTETGAECRCNCGDDAPHRCIKPTGQCVCSAGWTECPDGLSGPDCSRRDRCSDIIYKGKACDPRTSELVRCHLYNFLNNATCSKGCNEERRDCECGVCENGICSADGKCVCAPGYYGEDCSKGGQCSGEADGVTCWNSTHSITCFNDHIVEVASCKSGTCSESCNWKCCPAEREESSTAWFSTLSAASVTLGIVFILLIACASLYAAVSLGGFRFKSEATYQLQVYDGDTNSEEDAEGEDQEDPPTESVP